MSKSDFADAVKNSFCSPSCAKQTISTPRSENRLSAMSTLPNTKTTKKIYAVISEAMFCNPSYAKLTISIPPPIKVLQLWLTEKKTINKKKRPNIILIMSDDMGYSDIAPYGGEIYTPNLSSLAQNGLKFTQFYNNLRQWL